MKEWFAQQGRLMESMNLVVQHTYPGYFQLIEHKLVTAPQYALKLVYHRKQNYWTNQEPELESLEVSIPQSSNPSEVFFIK